MGDINNLPTFQRYSMCSCFFNVFFPMFVFLYHPDEQGIKVSYFQHHQDVEMSQKGTQSAFEVSGTFPRWHRLHRVVGVRGDYK